MDSAWADDREPLDEFDRLARMNSRRAHAEKQVARGRELPTGLLVAHFIRFYGIGAWLNPAYPTRDHIVPFQWFSVLLSAMANVSAAEQLAGYMTALLAGAMVHSGEEGHATRQRHVDQLLAQAYPETATARAVTAPNHSRIEVVSR